MPRSRCFLYRCIRLLAGLVFSGALGYPTAIAAPARQVESFPVYDPLPAITKRLISEMPGLRRSDYGIMAGYLAGYDFVFASNVPRAIARRRAWQRVGHRFEAFLARRLADTTYRVRLDAAMLLGGVGGARPVEAILRRYRYESSFKVRRAMDASLAQLGYRTRAMCARLLSVCDGLRPSLVAGTPQRYADLSETALLLCFVHSEQAVAVQNTLAKRPYIDGALAEQVFPLLRFRDADLWQERRRLK